jgi:hypothetical protein
MQESVIILFGVFREAFSETFFRSKQSQREDFHRARYVLMWPYIEY